MRAFPTLCYRARMAGARKLVFAAKGAKWTAEAYEKAGSDAVLAKASGRTGEEALRNLVGLLEAA